MMRIKYPAQFVTKSRHLVFQRRSRSVSKEEDGEFDRFSDWMFTVNLQYSKHSVELSEILGKALRVWRLCIRT